MNSSSVTALKVALVETNPIVRGGIELLFRRLSRFKIQLVSLLEDATSDWIEQADICRADIYILNPIYGGLNPRAHLQAPAIHAKFIAISYGSLDETHLHGYDGVLHLTDGLPQVAGLMDRLIAPPVEEEVEPMSDQLTPRERDVLIGVAKGLTNKEIATELHLSPHTVITHRRNLASKLDIRSASGLTMYAIMCNLIPNPKS